MKKKVILSTGPSSITGGALIHSALLEFFADKLNCKSIFVGFDKPFDYSEDKAKKIDYYFPAFYSENSVATQNALASYAVLSKILELAEHFYEADYEVLLFASFLLPFGDLIVQARKILMRKNIFCRVLLLPTGSDIWKLGTRFPEITKEILLNADRIFTYSRRFSEQISTSLKYQKNVIQIPPLIATDHFKPINYAKKEVLKQKFNFHPGDLVLVHISNMRYIKGLINTVRIAQSMAAIFHNSTYLVFVGPKTNHLDATLAICGFQKNEKSDFDEYKLENLTIRVYGAKKEVLQFHQIADYCLNSSYHDSFNTSLAEGMACGVPIISSSVVGLLDYIDGENAGLFYDYPEFSNATIVAEEEIHISDSVLGFLAHEAIKILNERDKWTMMSVAARNFVLSNFSTETLINKYIDLLKF